ncbi:MAG: O-acetyl-ADP-ribose deacetylase [Oscillospiraceae bacterium]
MPFSIVRNDITKMQVDAVVNAANNSLLGGGGVDGCIHRAAGPELLEECRTLHGCETGQAKITKGYNMPCRYIIHTVGPVWYGGFLGEREKLYSCYKNSLALAAQYECKSVAFPLISSGVYGYPKHKALAVAQQAITDFLGEQDMEVYLVVLDKRSVRISRELFRQVQEYIDDRYAKKLESLDTRRSALFQARQHEVQPCEVYEENELCKAACLSGISLEDMLKNTDETFSQSLLRLIDERGLTDSEVYRRANIDRRLFSKIRCDSEYRPKKQTVLAFALALELTTGETELLLKRAGYSLSDSIKGDVIVRFFLENGIYDIYTVNQALFQFDQSLIGC